ncbi:EAL domain-containing protein [Marinobacterium sp. D7]|uniref:bifunctional diguanylate cyclase/phosphodiesterase n=1 Tax=Marinobacterium ramblicola TaxID=2849041 RepID=UPI001C2D3464|nr:EAL domain-containing protein [Marinobacterium ramblicola]MBV1786865.1 EAL domain-containing protein [Marinobacterium ramblicola]
MPISRARKLRRWMRGLSDVAQASSKRSIKWLLLLLVALFVAGMWILSSLNLNYSQRALADLRRAEIEEIFLANLNQIVSRQHVFGLYTEGLARFGETTYALAGDELKPRLETAMKSMLQDFVGVAGIGVWFEKDRLPAGARDYTPYLFAGHDAEVGSRTSGLAAGSDYRQQPWFQMVMTPERLQKLAPKQMFWTPVYYSEQTDTAVLTIISPMFTDDGRLLGMVTTDWEAEQIIDLVSRVEVTQNSFSFLIDSNNRKLSSLSRSGDPLHAQHVMDALVAQSPSYVAPDYNALITSQTTEKSLESSVLEVDGLTYSLYLAGTPAGMSFGIGVPQEEIDAVLVPMRDSNYRILTITGLVILLLSGYLVYRISELVKELQASYTDPLTGLPNRARLLQDLNRAADGTLMLINLDRFKEINSLFGHRCGDQVIQTMSERLQQFARVHKIWPGARLYRLQGDEFALFGPNTEEDTQDLLQRYSEFLQDQQLVWQEQELNVDATLGIANAGDKGRGRLDSLLSQATVALRQARLQGRNFHTYDSEQGVEQAYEQNLVWARRVKDALQANRFEPWFQPILDNRSGKIAKYECLVRMIDAEGNTVGPGLFLGVAHRLRLGRQITRIMVDKCFNAFADRSIEFSINLAYSDMMDAELTAYICRRLQETGVGPRVIFELLESDGIENYDEIRQFIDQVKAYGCRIAIDDFGTGYSNFEHLLRLNVDLIKIDGSLIRHLHQDRTAYLVTQGIVQFARSLGIGTVAEFVHCEAVQQQVLALGVDFSQGEFVSMPAPDLVQGHAA